MEYTIKQVSEKTNLSIYTLRFYDKEGLLPLVSRTSTGIRKFTDNDIEWLNLICCLKNSGMSLEKIKEFMIFCLEGTKSCEERRALLEKHKINILSQIEQLKHSLKVIDFKIDHYKEVGVFHIDS
jgi:DNA-binding transcriptional MerR regulator